MVSLAVGPGPAVALTRQVLPPGDAAGRDQLTPVPRDQGRGNDPQDPGGPGSDGPGC
jgi:hypothetical protein